MIGHSAFLKERLNDVLAMKYQIAKVKYSHGILSLALGSITMDRSAGETMLIEICIDEIDLRFAVHKDENANRAHAHEKIIESLVLPGFLDVDDLAMQSMSRTSNHHARSISYLLFDIEMRAARAANADANIVLIEIVESKLSTFLVEGG